jgi:hypothetical protein
VIKPTKRYPADPAQMTYGFNAGLDVHSEITRDENHNHHYADDVENIHSYPPRGSHLKNLRGAAIERTTQRL